MEQKKRLQYIDCLRGFSMIFVVFQHVLTFSVPEVPRSWSAELILTFRMPLFFFISGFVSYKALFEWNWSNFKGLQIKKIRGQLLPTIVMFCLFVSTHDQQYEKWTFDMAKSGYWFTVVSFEIFLTYCIINMICRKIKLNWKLVILALSGIGITCIWYTYGHFYRHKYACLFSLAYYAQYYLYFIAGIIVKSKLDSFHKIIDNKYITFIVFIIAFVIPYIFPNFNKIITILARLWCIYSIFYQAREYFERKTALSRGLSLIGTHTLEIYFLHYFLLFRMPHIQSLLLNIINDKCFMGPSAEWFVELIIVGGTAIFLCFACVGIKKIISVFPIVSELCFGPKKNH